MMRLKLSWIFDRHAEACMVPIFNYCLPIMIKPNNSVAHIKDTDHSLSCGLETFSCLLLGSKDPNFLRDIKDDVQTGQMQG